jgi:hypothetical protein
MTHCPDTLANRADSTQEMIAEIERLRDTLSFYANPREHILDADIPDFYEEMDFGSRARAALGGAS